MKKPAFFLSGLLVGSILVVGVPVLAGSTSKTIDDVYNKSKSIIQKINDLQDDVDTVKNKTKTANDSLEYLEGLDGEIYDGSYYQAALQNNIAYNTVISCISAVIDTSYCETPEYIDLSIYDYDVSTSSIPSSVQNYSEVLNQYRESEQAFRTARNAE